jgi:hypothetical protein
MVQELFEGHDVTYDYSHPQLRFRRTSAPMQLDIYIPSLALAFEYQGEQHYGAHYLYGSSEHQRAKDMEKQQRCKQEGITLIHIPYWWDKQKSSLVATVRQRRPELLPDAEAGLPIPATPPAYVPACKSCRCNISNQL